MSMKGLAKLGFELGLSFGLVAGNPAMANENQNPVYQNGIDQAIATCRYINAKILKNYKANCDETPQFEINPSKKIMSNGRMAGKGRHVIQILAKFPIEHPTVKAGLTIPVVNQISYILPSGKNCNSVLKEVSTGIDAIRISVY